MLLQVLCARGAPIDAANRVNGSTLLTQAIYDRDEQKVRTLLALGADPTVPDLYDTMPIALAREWEFYAIVSLLTQAIEFTQLNVPLEEVFF